MKSNISIKEFFKNNYLYAYCIYFTMAFLNETTLAVEHKAIDIILKLIRYTTYLFFLIRLIIMLPEYKRDFCKKKWEERTTLNKISIIVSCILIISILINFLKTFNRTLIILTLIILSSYKVDYKKIIKYTMMLQIILTTFTVTLSTFNITQNYYIMRGKKYRYSLGFNYTTNLAQMVTFAIILYIYNNDFKIKYSELCVMQILNAFVFFITDSRTEFIMLEAIIVIMLCYKLKIVEKCKKICKKILGLFSYTFMIYPIISFIVVLLYPLGGFFNKLNDILSNRLSQTYEVLQENKINLFGSNIEFIGNGIRSRLKYGQVKSNYVDGQYLQILFSNGLIVALCFIILLGILVILLYKRKQYKELFLCAIYLLFGLLNPRIITLTYCPILFLIIPTFTGYFNSNNYKKLKQGNNVK